MPEGWPAVFGGSSPSSHPDTVFASGDARRSPEPALSLLPAQLRQFRSGPVGRISATSATNSHAYQLRAAHIPDQALAKRAGKMSELIAGADEQRRG